MAESARTSFEVLSYRLYGIVGYQARAPVRGVYSVGRIFGVAYGFGQPVEHLVVCHELVGYLQRRLAHYFELPVEQRAHAQLVWRGQQEGFKAYERYPRPLYRGQQLPVIAAEAAKLKAENGQLEQQLEVSRRDQHDVFHLYQKSEQLNRQLKDDADTLRALREHAPDKLKEALATAEQRKTAKHSSPFKGSGSNRGGK